MCVSVLSSRGCISREQRPYASLHLQSPVQCLKDRRQLHTYLKKKTINEWWVNEEHVRSESVTLMDHSLRRRLQLQPRSQPQSVPRIRNWELPPGQSPQWLRFVSSVCHPAITFQEEWGAHLKEVQLWKWSNLFQTWQSAWELPSCIINIHSLTFLLCHWV